MRNGSVSKRWCAALVGLGMLLSGTAGATVFGLQAVMDCAQANAGLGTCAAGGSGTGTAALEFDDVTDELSWVVSWSGLSGTLTVAHFHGPAGPGVNAGVQVDFLALGGGTNPSIGSTTIDAAQASALLAGNWYVNVHSTTFPGGEIRGQITLADVPEPATALALMAGLAGLAAARRQRRRGSLAR